MGRVKRYTKKESELIKKYYSDNGADYCAALILKKLGIIRTSSAVKQKANALGLKTNFPNPSRFVKGHTPYNTGKPMSKNVYDKCSKTFFKIGRKPHNTKKDYSLRKRYDKKKYLYWMVKESDYSWRLLHRVIYENYYNTKLTYNQIVIFKDKNHDNIHPENLMIITREDNMLRNNQYLKYPKEVVKAIRLNNKIKKVINAKKQNKRLK